MAKKAKAAKKAKSAKKATAAMKATASGPSSAERNWTFMVYMAAEQSRELDSVAVRDLREMERGCKDNDNVHVVVMLDRHWPGAQMYEIGGEGSRLIRQVVGKTDMGDKHTLIDFITRVAESPDYLAKNYCLILWGHSFGLGFGRDHDNPLTLLELNEALERFNQAREYNGQKGGGRLEILGTNSCSMSYVEAAFQLRNSAQLMIASQITVPFAGLPYDVIFQRIDDSVGPDDLSRMIVDAYVTQFDDLPGGDRLAMTLLDLTKAKELDTAIEELGKEIDQAIRDSEFSSDLLGPLRDLFMGAAAGDVRPLIDLTTLLLSLAEEKDPLFAGIVPAAQRLLEILHGDKKGPSESAKNKPKLVAHHKFSKDLDDLKGIGIYAPFITDEGMKERLGLSEASAKNGDPTRRNGKEEYEELDVFPAKKKAAWPRLVYDGLRRTIPRDLIVAIDGIGELQAGDRADVAQIIMSIEASLNQFDRAIKKAKEEVEATLTKPPMSLKNVKPGDAVPDFSAPWLRLIAPLSVEALEDVKKLQALIPAPKGLVQSFVSVMNPSPTVSTVVLKLSRLETALTHVERVTRRGLTHARFGLGLLAPSQSGFGLDPPKSGEGLDPPKSGEGLDPPKSGEGLDPPKSGEGLDPPKSGEGLPGDGGDLRADRGLRRVADLFVDVGRVMHDLERTTANLEHVARMALVVSPMSASISAAKAAASDQIETAFLILEDASARTRRVIRRALAHPIYGLGPGEGQLTFEVRQDLASRGGLDRRRLKLL